MVNNLEVAVLFYQVADLLDLEPSNSQRARAYRRAADSIAACPDEVSVLCNRGELQQISGVGKQLEKRLHDLLQTGRFAYLDELRAELPPGVIALLDLPGLPIRAAVILQSRYGINDLDALAQAIHERRLDELPGIGTRKQAALLEGIARLRRTKARPGHAT